MIAPRLLGLVAVIVLLSCLLSPLGAQQFQDQSVARLPDALEYSSQVAIADVDGDGDLDLAFANGRGFASGTLEEQVRLLINDGNGFFTDLSSQLGQVLGYGRDVEFGDVDGDGDPDMVIANDFLQLPRLLINDGAGSFADQTGMRLPGLVLASSHCSFGDVDDDGDLDLWFTRGSSTRFGAGQPQLYINDGAGFYTNESSTRVPLNVVPEPMDCIFGDLDGDFDLDVVAGHRATGASRIYVNDGTGFFSNEAPGQLPNDANTYSYDLGDLDGDGDLDLFGANSLVGSAREAVFVNDGDGFFTNLTSTWIPGNNNPSVDDNDSKFFDYDNDGDLDVIIASLGSSERILRNNGTSFQLMSGVISAVPDSSLDVEVGDLDGDGDLDVVTAQGESGGFRNRLYLNTGSSPDTQPPSFPQTLELTDTLDAVGPYVVRGVIRDQMTSDKGAFYDETVLVYSVDGGLEQEVPLVWSGHEMYRGEIPGQAAGTEIVYFLRATDDAGNIGASSSFAFTILIPPPTFLRGDCNLDAMFDISDAVRALDTLFSGGLPFDCDDSCDANDDGAIDLGDPITILNGLFIPGVPFGGACGEDDTADALDCAIDPMCP